MPVLNSANQIVYDSNGNEVTTLFTAAQQYIRNLQLTAVGTVPSGDSNVRRRSVAVHHPDR